MDSAPTAPPSEDVLDEVRLSLVRGVGPLTRLRLVEAFGSAGRALSANPHDLAAVRGVGPALTSAIAAAPDRDRASALLADAAARGIRVLTPAMPEYPVGLREIHDPPAVLYCRGAILEADRRGVAIVGSRRATRYGLRQADLFARGLAAAGVTVVSGLARGIDGVAHRAALEAAGRTIAVLAGGLAKIYPPEHAQLADAVAASGALIAEAPPPMPPMSGSFPQRNRIISALSVGVLVIEAADRSGALITARHAAEQGRDAFALPGPVDSPLSSGCHRLIQEGAKLVRCVEDVLEELDGLPVARASAPPTTGSPRQTPAEVAARPVQRDWPDPERAILAGVTDGGASIDGLLDTTGLAIDVLLAGLTRLEAAGALVRTSGTTVRLA